MHILHVETGMHFYGGARQVAYLVDGMSARGVRCDLVCPPGAAIAGHVRGIAGATVHELPCAGDLDLGFIGRLTRVLRARRPDLVHLHSRRGADVLGPLAARRAGLPAVLSRRVDNPENQGWAAIKYRLVDHTICISEGIAAVLRQCGVAAERLSVVRSALDPEPWRHPEHRDELCRTFGLEPRRLCLGIVAQLIERKGHAVLLDALQRCRQRERLQLIVFGRGPLEAALKARAESLGLAGQVHFAGFRDDLARWVGALDLLVHPAFMEGLGIALLQASAAGVPIVAARAGGIPEAVRPGVNGRLFEPGDVQALADNLDELALDTTARQALGNGGRALIEREFSVEAMVDGNLAVYRQVLAQRRSGGGHTGRQ